MKPAKWRVSVSYRSDGELLRILFIASFFNSSRPIGRLLGSKKHCRSSCSHHGARVGGNGRDLRLHGLKLRRSLAGVIHPDPIGDGAQRLNGARLRRTFECSQKCAGVCGRLLELRRRSRRQKGTMGSEISQATRNAGPIPSQRVQV